MNKEIIESQEEENLGKMETLKKEGFVYFDIGLTPEERNSMQEIKIENESEEFDYFGPINNELLEKLTNYFSKIGAEGSNSEAVISNISMFVDRVARNTQEEFNAEAVWICIRTTLPNNEFNIPRWHRDQGYFESDEEFYKLVFPITGKPTRFAKVIEGKQKHYEQLDLEVGLNNGKLSQGQINQEEFDKEDRRLRQELILVVEEIESPGNEQAALYTVNNRKTSMIHSEPEMNKGPRIFMQVLPGPKEKIEEWQKRCEE